MSLQLCNWPHTSASAPDVDLIADGINVVLGRNGAGKTALCRQLVGLDRAPPGARQVLDGVDITALGARQRSVAMVFQEFINYPSLSVFDNIASPLRAARLPRAAIAGRVEPVAAALGLTDLLRRQPDELSGGQQQRVALARALASGARLLVLDEPFANLDLKLREAAVLQLRTLLAERGAVVVYTSSDPREALALADQLVLMQDGVILQAGPALNLYRQPGSIAAAHLLSDPGINLIDVHVAGATLVVGSGAGAELELACPPALTQHAGGHRLGIRPEHLRLAQAADTTPAPDMLRLPASLQLAETNGSDTYLHVDVCGAQWVAHLDGLVTHRPGADLVIEAGVADILLFAEGSTGPQAQSLAAAPAH